MSDRERKEVQERLEKGYVPREDGVRGGYQPETNEADSPPTGGGAGREPTKDED